MENPLDFLLIQPIYLPLLSFFLNLVLLLILSVSWVYNKSVACENSDGFMKKRSTKMSSTFSKLVVMSCVSLSVFYSVLSLLSCVRWHSNVWTFFDLLLAALTWGTISMYLRGLYTDSHEQKLPYLLRIWWVLYLLISCYRLVVDFVLYRKQELVSVHNVVSELVGVCAGLFLCCSCLWKRGEGERTNLLEEPLLIENEVCDDEVTTPFAKAGFLSLMSFSWMSPLVTLGNEKIIDSKDVPQVDNSDRAENLFRVFRSKLEWDDGERRITTFKLVKALFLTVWRDILLSFLFAFVYTMSCYVAPYLMDSFVQYLNGERQYKYQGYVLVTIFFVAKLVECQTRRHWFFRGGKAGLGMKAVLVSMIYEKGLTLPCHSKQGQTSGEIINLMAVDADRLNAFTWFMHDPWILVLQVSLALWILYKSLGLGSVAAFPAFILVMLANYPFAKLEDKFQSNLMKSKDNRMKKTSEVLLNMRILKLQGWEMKFLSKILDLRHVEAGWLKKFVYNSAAMSSVLWTAPSFISATAFGACVLLKIPLESGKILAALATFRILQSPIYKLPETISMFVQVKVSLGRIASFLCLDDLEKDVVERLTSRSLALEVRNGYFSWDESSSIPTLRDVSFEVSQGMNVAVCGTVGSGKSSLLSSILGEVPKISGTVKVCGRKAYVAQSPWIQSGKVEDNILFGQPMEREWYERVLEACSLNKDLELLPFHDQTVIGERGINISGGQKQRIQIARALYQNADIYLFDDPFSAVDAHTGSHLFNEVILGILKDKTVIYVTHQVEFLPEADLILVMKDGKITQAGRYNEILDSGTDFMELVGAHTDALATVDTYEQGCASSESTTNKEKEAPSDEEKLEKDSGKPRGGQLVQQEEREKGKVGFTVYKKYMALAYGGAVIPIILLVQILFQILNIGSNYWMTWVTPVSKDVEPPVSGFTLILVYVLLAIASSLCILFRALLVSMTGFKMATELFTQMHLRVFRGSMSFFDVTPMGRILNRASTDQSVVDLRLPGQFAYVAIAAINILGIMGVMIQVAWQVLIIFIPVVAASAWYRQYYISAARELARLAGISRSPLVHHFSETLSGVTTIRSFDQEPRFLGDIMKLNDCLSRLRFHSTGAMEWLCFRLELLSTIAFALSLVIVVSAPEGTVNPSFAGLAITYALNLNSLQSTLVWTLCDLENKMISVERMLQYIDIPSEPSLVIESTRPEKSWPSRGEITIMTAFFAFIYTIASYVGPALIDTLVQYLNGRRQYNNEGYVLVTTFFLAKLLECLAKRHWYFRLQKIGIRMRSCLVAMIYEKGLTLSCHSKKGRTSGEIINFMTVDAERVGSFCWYIHDSWLLLLQIGLAMWLLYINLGLASIAALAATILVMLVNIPFGKMQERFQEKLMEAKDSRMKSTSEILRNMRILKLQGWEMKFLSKVFDLRTCEEGWLKKYVYNSAVISFVFWGAPTLVSVSTFGACILLGVPLESGKILSAIAIFSTLRQPIFYLPETISMVVQTKVSLDRIASYLCQENLNPDVVENLPKGSSDIAVEVSNSTLSWDVSSANPTLKDINLKVFHGMKVAVCGTVGSGKSSLLSSILGEVPKISGSLKVCGTKGYVAQSPWIQSGTIEENILFGKAMERERYEKVVEACSLSKDLEVLSFGDQTVIGERGINLSGGQKQRIQIARALYQDADIYLFDDPFSAVDAHTGTHLFKEVLLGLLSSKTVIYVTHQVEFLPAADLILVMKDGRISQAGRYNDILNSGTDFMELIGAHQEALAVVGSVHASSASEKPGLVRDAIDSEEKQESQDLKNGKSDTGEANRQLVQEEEREKGSVALDVYWKYITLAYGGALVPFILLAQVLFQLLQIGSNYWMAWGTPVSKDVEAHVNLSTLMIVYVALAAGSCFCILVRSTLLVTAGYKTATELFHRMHRCIFRSPMSFFDSTPSGRIMNRASTDQSAVDLDIPYQFSSLAVTVIQVIGIIGVMSQVSWLVFLVFIPVVAASIWYQRYYIAAARELSRLDGVCKAPLIQHFSETISGSTTIRSFNQESRFRGDNMRLSDAYSRPKFYLAGAVEWLCFRLDMLSSLVFAFSLIFLISIPTGVIDPSLAGLAITYGLNLNTQQAWLMWALCNLENKIISVERILQYASVSSEPPLVIESNRPENSWPSLGDVDIRDLQVRYAPHMPLVLRGITCTFKGGLRTGIVGRTGSGKSTLIQTLFRIVEPSAGEIRIDGVNILTIGLHDLRLRLSIIPQDPTMFEGTVRSNLDPLEEYTDDQIWEALDKCQLGDEVRKKEHKLDSSVSENGENWSMGQRQLVCLGRVLLKRSKILVLDEATASVDTATDNLIQKTLREHFSDCTVITIAHRISSVIDSDMVLLLSNGIIEEYDSPVRLLEDKSSSFAKLVAEYTSRSSSSSD
ncbi:unnamed protein product [Brassica napus]|uniref:ABC-type xenobiotic transporter n=1 Tax=Brassica napus TaxID=3708 RepID=A0A816Y806_BRANA|nr:unnamed protein product [Brassica napus]